LDPTKRKYYSPLAVAAATGSTALTPLVGFWVTFDLADGLYASVYLAGCALWFILILPKLRCVNCYYFDKLCPIGGGKMAPVFFRADSGSDLWARRAGKAFWPYWYFGVPALGLALALLINPAWRALIHGAIFLAAAIISWAVNRHVWRPLGADICFRADPATTAR